MVSFISTAGSSGLWNGIYVDTSATATLEYVKIENALRGITLLDQTTVLITDSLLQGNNLGVHVLGGDVTIQNTSILDHLWYGIKEDKAGQELGRPTVNNCTFTNNQMNYYHYELLGISLEQLNALEGNSGNQ